MLQCAVDAVPIDDLAIRGGVDAAVHSAIQVGGVGVRGGSVGGRRHGRGQGGGGVTGRSGAGIWASHLKLSVSFPNTDGNWCVLPGVVHIRDVALVLFRRQYKEQCLISALTQLDNETI